MRQRIKAKATSAAARFVHHLNSPITARSVVFATAIVLLGFMFVKDYLVRQQARERYERMSAYFEQSERSLQSAKEQLNAMSDVQRFTENSLASVQELAADIRKMSEHLDAERIERERERAVVPQQKASRKVRLKVKKPGWVPCTVTVTNVERHGKSYLLLSDTQVIKCRK